MNTALEVPIGNTTYENTRNTPEHVVTKKPLIKKVLSNADNIFIKGEIETRSLKDVLKEGIQENNLPRSLFVVGMSFIARNLPKDIREALQEKNFDKFPLDIPELDNYRILPKIGGGMEKIIYFLGKDDEQSFSVGLPRRNYTSEKEALFIARDQQKEVTFLKELYKDVPNFVPNENYVLFKDHEGKYAILYIKEFIPDPIVDLFSLSKEQVQKICSHNTAFQEQLLKFATVTLEQSDVVLDRQVDFLGKNNITISGIEGNERLVMLDPHLIKEKTEDRQLRLKARLKQIKELLEEK